MKSKVGFYIVGTVTAIGETQTFPSGFAKRQIILETSSDPAKWSRPIAVQLTKDRVSLGDSLAVGKDVQVEGYIGGREWIKEGQVPRYFVDLVAETIKPYSDAEVDEGLPKMEEVPDDPDNIPF